MKQYLRIFRHWYLVAGLFLAGPLARAQAPGWQAAMALGDDSGVATVATDASGNVYVTGSFSGSASFGALVLTNSGGTDAFVAKWSAAASAFVWAQQAGGNGTSGAFAKALAVSGNAVYLAGEFDGAPSFGSLGLPGSSAGTNGVFVAKLLDAGTSASFAWVQAGGGPGADLASGIAVAGTSVYVAGSFDGASASFGSTTLLNTAVGGPTPGGGTSSLADIFVAKLVDAGPSAQFAGALRIGGAQSERASALVASGSSVYLAGSSTGYPVTFEGLPASVSAAPLFVAKLTDASPMGSFTWVQALGGSISDGIGSLAVAGSAVYITGTFSGPFAYFGPLYLPNNTPMPFTSDFFLAKLLDTGTGSSFAWARNLPASMGNKVGRALAVSGANVYVAGTFTGTTNFEGTNLTSAGYEDIFVARFNDTGAAAPLAWVQQAGGQRSDFATALCLAGSSLQVAGSFQWSTASFGSITLALTSPYSISSGFWASIPQSSALAATMPEAAANVSLFPNPARTSATLRLPATAAPRTVQVLDALGRLVSQQLLPAQASVSSLDLRALPPGTYLVRCDALVARLLVD